MPTMTDHEAYNRLTRVITRMHASERDILDRSDNYREAMDAIIMGDEDTARELVTDMRTDAGDAWRHKQEVTFWGENYGDETM